MRKTTQSLSLKDLESSDREVKYGQVRAVLAAAEKKPAALLPYLDDFTRLLDSDNRILKWMAIEAVGAVAASGAMRRPRAWVDRLTEFLSGGEMITANHAVNALKKVATCLPEYKPRIIRALLRVEHRRYETAECRNIVLGKVLEAFSGLRDPIRYGKELAGFAKRQMKNRRAATRKKAGRLEHLLAKTGQNRVLSAKGEGL